MVGLSKHRAEKVFSERRKSSVMSLLGDGLSKDSWSLIAVCCHIYFVILSTSSALNVKFS